MIDPTGSLYRIAALYVDPRGVYSTIPGVDVWGEERDARTYAGPHPVVAHPPCERWGRFFWRDGSTVPGEDGGCYLAALASIRQWGGVIEHPSGSGAWDAHGLPRPTHRGGWIPGARPGEWTCSVDQLAYGHPAIKRTWLYLVGHPAPMLAATTPPVAVVAGGRAADLRARGLRLCTRAERSATPRAFADALIAIARRVQ